MLTIRSLNPEDYPQWLPLWQGYQAFYKVEIAQEVTAHTWVRLISSHTPIACFVAENQGEIIGIVHYLFHASTWSNGDYCYLQDLFTKPSARGQGVGRKLIEAVIEAAQQQKANRVYWLTHETNYAGRSLYDKVASNLGFIQYRKMLS
jgi:GNAT superfamily N-acetyltransferase